MATHLAAWCACRRRCFRGAKCLLTSEHEGTAECAAKNNAAGKNRFVRRRRPGAGAVERRAQQRAPLQLQLQVAPHERQGQVRNGRKRPAVGEAERGETMEQDAGAQVAGVAPGDEGL